MTREELHAFTTPKRFHSTVEHDGSTFEIEIETPDLSDGYPSGWGDWGPMYTFEFDEPRAVHITYRCKALGIEDAIDLPVSEMRLDSPMEYERRQEHPLFLRFQDPSRGLEFKGYLDPEGQPAVVEAKQLPLHGAEVISLLLWQPPQAPTWPHAEDDRRVA